MQYANVLTWENFPAFFKQDFSNSVNSVKNKNNNKKKPKQLNSLWNEIKKLSTSLPPWGMFLN